MKDVDIIFVDIDWTIFNHSEVPSFFDMESIDALKEAQKQGVLVFLCTARPYHSVKRIKLLDIFKPDGMILANGGLAFYGDEVIYETRMDPKDFEKICEIALSVGANVEGIRRYDSFLIKPVDKAVIELYKTFPEDFPKVEDYHNQEVYGMSLFAYKDLDEKILPQIPKNYYYFRYHDYGVDAAEIPHVKGDTIKIVLDKLHISRDRAMAIGDDLADISMFEQVKYGVAMGNGKDEVIEAATHVTASVSDHGVKKIIESHVLKK